MFDLSAALACRVVNINVALLLSSSDHTSVFFNISRNISVDVIADGGNEKSKLTLINEVIF